MSKKSGSCLTTQHQKDCVCLYNKTVIPFDLVVYELIYTTRAHGIMLNIQHWLRYVYTLRLLGANFVSWCMLYTYEGNKMHSLENDAVHSWLYH